MGKEGRSKVLEYRLSLGETPLRLYEAFVGPC